MLVIAHRMPDTAAACEVLARAGAHVFEVDVQVGAAGLVVSHYAPVPRFGPLHRDGWRLRWGQATGSLAAQLALVPPDARVLLDLKERTETGRAKMLNIIVGFGDAHRFVASGSHLDDLATLRMAGIQTWRSVGNAATLHQVLGAVDSETDGVTVRHTLLTPAVVDQLHTKTPKVIAWTVNDTARARVLCEMGVDGITTDRRAVMRLLADR